jgi:hypothetical protein
VTCPAPLDGAHRGEARRGPNSRKGHGRIVLIVARGGSDGFSM